MKVLHGIAEMRAWSRRQHRDGHRIGFVPTMGYLHDAHLTLVDLVRDHSDVTVVSIFVNPTQFDRAEDLETYPRDEERDLRLCEERGVDVVWLPTKDDIYPAGFASWVVVNGLDQHLCGASRPGHFRGVTTVVSILFNIVQPDVAAFGRKDAQQARIIQRMTQDLAFGTEILLGDTLREDDGLALSSRNVRLTPEHRAQAPALRKALLAGHALFEGGETNARAITEYVANLILDSAPAAKLDYVQLVDWEQLQPVQRVTATSLLAVAVYFDTVRLIDNIILEPSA